MSSFSSYASGQNYTAVTLNIYRTPLRDIVMTSFDRYNINLRAYQQNPWMVNFDGAPLWSQSGKSVIMIFDCRSKDGRGDVVQCDLIRLREQESSSKF